MMKNRFVPKTSTKKTAFICKTQNGAASCFKVQTDLNGDHECDTTPIEWINEPVDLGCNPTHNQIQAALGQISATSTCAISSYVNITYDPDCDVIGKNGCLTTYIRVFTGTDDCGNISAICREITYRDDLNGPVITLHNAGPEDGYLGCNPSDQTIEDALGYATYTDDCACEELPANQRDGPIESNDCGRSKTRYFTAVDECGIPAEASRTVFWSDDTTPPIIIATGTPQDGQLGCNPTPAEIEAALGTAQVMDNCGAELFVETGLVLEQGCFRSQTRTWTAIDDCGNEATPVQRTAYWKVDLEGPTIECPEPQECIPVHRIVDCEGDIHWTPPDIIDNCGGDVDLTYVEEDIVIKCRTWIATDDCGNTSTCRECVAVTPCDNKGCTIGFWKNQTNVWDGSLTATVDAGFVPSSDFFAFLGIAPGSGGLPSPLTMLQALNLGGGGCFNLARQGVAALLSSAAFGTDYDYPAPITDFNSLKNAIASALLANNCGTLASKLDAANNNHGDPDVCGPLKPKNVQSKRSKPFNVRRR